MKAIQAFTADYSSDGTDGEKIAGKMYVSGKKMRLDVPDFGPGVSLIGDGEARIAYVFNAQEKKALSVPYDESATGQTPGEVLFWDPNSPNQPKFLGEEKVDGKTCVVYEFTSDTIKSKAWIDKSIAFPLRYETTTEEGIKVTARFTNITFGNVDPSLFLLPEGTEVLDMSGLVGTPTPREPTPSVAGGPPVAGLARTAIVGPVPAELKNTFAIPDGFTLVPDTGQSVEDVTTGTFKATASWTGKATTQQLADFYKGTMPAGWKPAGSTAGGTSLDISFTEADSDPLVTLNVRAVASGGMMKLTLTISNGDIDF